jgi:gas vesicle protein
VRNAASDTVAAARDTLSDTYQSGLAAATSAGDQLTETFTQSRDTLVEAIESHPFVMGGVGLLVGAVIASALPVTHAENRLFGDTSDDIKNRARDIASEGLHVATAAAHDVYHESVSRAQEQGLSADVVRQTVKDVGEKVKDVVEQASEALEDTPSSASTVSQR